MFARFVTMLAIFAITFVTTVASAHAAGMGMSAVHVSAAHVGQMKQAPSNSNLSCDRQQHCGSADGGICEFVCGGVSAFLPSSNGEAGHEYHHPASYDASPVATHASRMPGLDERPPKLRLL